MREKDNNFVEGKYFVQEEESKKMTSFFREGIYLVCEGERFLVTTYRDEIGFKNS